MDSRDPGSGGVGTVKKLAAGGAAEITRVGMVLDVEIVAAGLGIRILDKMGGRSGGVATFIGEVENVGGLDRLRVGSAPAHRKLMIVIVDCIALGQRPEVWIVTGCHVVKAHRNSPLEGTLIIGWRLAVHVDLPSCAGRHPRARFLSA